jgi:general secretion pathway protein K
LKKKPDESGKNIYMSHLRNHKGKMYGSGTRVIRSLGSDRGFALVLVLWILVLLTAMVAEFAYSMRTEVNITRNFKEATQAYYITHSGLIRSIVEMLRNTSTTKNREFGDEAAESRVWRVNVPIPSQGFGAGEFTVYIDNVAGLIDLNTASEKLLRLMANTLDLSDDRRAVIVDSILDWRDKDDFHRLNGAENTYYKSLADPYGCKNGPFDSVEELLLVRGVTPELFEKHLKAIVTTTPKKKAKPSGKGHRSRRAVRTNVGQININAAPRQLLEALPQITPLEVQNLVDHRIERDFSSLLEVQNLMGAQTFSAISPYLTLSLSPYYTIRAEGRVTGSSVRQTIRAVVQIDEQLPGGYEILSWQDQYY